jgi:hypothetical protein
MGAEQPPGHSDPGPDHRVAALYPGALPQVYGYLLPRCGSTALAEDLTAETFMAAVAAVRDLRESGARFRNDVVNGVGGRQIILEDPSGNPVELFEPVRPEARTASL